MPQSRFLLEAYDLEQCCPVLQAMLTVDDPQALRAILGEVADEDPDLQWTYHLDDEQIAAIAAKFKVTFDVAQLESKDLVIGLFRWHRRHQTPYLVHGGYELPLLLDGRKKLARMSSEYPPMKFKGEDRFDHWVAKGVLHREEVNEPYDPPFRTFRGQTYLGHRTVYYTPKGEEWRIPAMKLIWHASGKSGGWNEHFERLEGMLFGYEDWQNDWWIDEWLARRGGIAGIPFCCAVTAAGLEWIETAGFRALPPTDQPALTIMSYDQETEADLCAATLVDPCSAAVVRFNMAGRDARNLLDLHHGGPWEVKAERIPEFNGLLRGSVAIVARRDGAVENVPVKSQVPTRSA
jgi:hypothetical protein